MKKFHPKTVASWGFAVALVLLFLINGFFYLGRQRLIRAFDWVEHTHQVLEQCERLSTLVETENASVRSFIVSGRPYDLQPFQRAPVAIERTIALIRELTHDNDLQQRDLDALVSLLEEREDHLSDIVAEQERGQTIDVREALTSPREQALSATMSQRINAMVLRENDLLAARKAVYATNTRWSLFILLLATFLSLGLLGIGYLLLTREIASRRRAQRFLFSIIDNIPHMIVVKDAESLRFTLMNKASERFIGMSQSETVGKTEAEIQTPRLGGDSAFSDEKALEGSQPIDIPAETVVTPDAGARVLHIRKIPIMDDAGLPLNLLSISEDITERRQAERRLATQYAVARVLATSESLTEAALPILQTVCENLEWDLGALWRVDPEANTLRCLNLWHAESIQADDFDALTRSRPYASGEGLPGKVWAEAQPSWIVRTSDVPGYPRTAAVVKAGLSSAFACPIVLGTDVLGVIEVFSTISYECSPDLIETMRAVARQLAQFVERKNAESRLKLARDTALESARFKSEFMANMSHEIRTPMNAIIGMTELLTGTMLTDRQKEFVDVVHRSGESLLQIINDILDFSKIEAGKFILDAIDFQVHEPVEQVARMLAGRAQSKGVELAVFIHSDVPRVLAGDPARLSQVITNLVGNAVKFTEKGEVVVDVSKVDETELMTRLCIEVRDTGMGISEDAQKRLFQAFSQADGSTTRKYGGTGLGLAISRRLVELMGGEIHFVSRLGEGSTFTVTVPFAKAHQAEAAQAMASVAHLAGLRVLIVDDNETNRRILKLQTATWGMVSDSASGGAEALVLLRRAVAEGRPYALAFSDLHMPDMDGLELASAIQADSSHGQVKTIILTSLGRVLSTEELKRAGVSGSLTKPIRQSDLLECITRVISGTISVTDTEAALQTVLSVPETPPLTPARGAPIAPSEAALLLAEDNAVNRSVAQFQLSKLGYRVTLVENGRQAVDALMKRDFDVVLMDCQMPLMDGYQASVEIRWQEGSKRRTPIIAMTANALEGDREKCLSAGMDDYLSKPVRASELRAMLEKWLPRAKPLSTEPVDMDRLHELTYDDDDAMRRLIAIYFRETERELILLADAVQNRKTDDVHRMAHGCAGASASYGMSAIIAPLHELEAAAKTSSWDATAALMTRIQDAYQILRTTMAPYLQESDDKAA